MGDLLEVDSSFKVNHRESYVKQGRSQGKNGKHEGK